MILTEVNGIIQSVNFETRSGFWVNSLLFPPELEYVSGKEVDIPVDRHNLNWQNLFDLYGKKIKVTVELLED